MRSWAERIAMSTETNRALVRRAVVEVWNGLDLELADRLYDPSYINHGGIIPDLVTGPESIKVAVVLQHTAFPSLQVRERAMAAEENVVELTWVARQGREPRDHASHGPRYLAHGTTLIRCAGGRIAESWTTWDCPVLGDVAAATPPRRSARPPVRLAG